MTSIPLPVFPQNPVSVSNRILSRPQKRTQTAALWAVFCCLLFPFAPPAHPQGVDEWAWMGGSSTLDIYDGQPGVYGTLGTPAAGNVPGGRWDASSWTDSSGNLWLFGGDGVRCQRVWNADLNDLWEFNPSTNEWTWMGGQHRERRRCRSEPECMAHWERLPPGTSPEAAMGL